MIENDDINEIVEIDFEVGHTSIIRTKPTTNHNPPRTHDWKIYLRSTDINGDLNCLIKRCVFHLHSEYSNNKRELTSTPFAIQETGYAGFHLPIEIYFKTNTEPTKFRIEYDLDLHKNIDENPHRKKESYVRKYRCTFSNPDSIFRQKILAAGGKIVENDQNNSDTNHKLLSSPETIIRRSPPQKRPISSVSTTNTKTNKKVKLEKSANNIKNEIKSKKQNENINKTTIIEEKSKLTSHKSSSVLEENLSSTLPIKLSNKTVIVNGTNENSSINVKPNTSIKLTKSHSTDDIKSVIQSTKINIKKKEVPSSSSQSMTNSKTQPKKSLNRTLSIKSPSTMNNKQESLSQSTPITIDPSTVTSTTSTTINKTKKVLKKSAPLPTSEERSRSSSNQTQESLSTKSQTNLKRELSSSSIKKTQNKKRIDKSNFTNEQSQSNSSSLISPKFQNDSSTNLSSQISVSNDKSIEINDDQQNNNKKEKNVDKKLDQSDSSHKQISTQLSCSEQSDITDSEVSIDDEMEENDLPTSLTNEDLRYKLIYIYNRFQLNSLNDLIIFVRFFKRNQLIDISSLPMTKASNDMFTYDLLSLSPSHIVELATDLGYTTTNVINSIKY